MRSLFARTVLLVPFLCLTLPGSAAQKKDAEFSKNTYTFKKVGAVEIHADVYRAADERVRPVVVWLHGGALIVGSRTSVPKNLLDLCKSEGYALVSLDYRLAPEVKLPAIIEE